MRRKVAMKKTLCQRQMGRLRLRAVSSSPLSEENRWDQNPAPLAGCTVTSPRLVGTGGEVDGCVTFGADMRLVKLVRKNLFLRTTIVALTNEGLEILEGFPSGTMLRGRGHFKSPSLYLFFGSPGICLHDHLLA